MVFFDFLRVHQTLSIDNSFFKYYQDTSFSEERATMLTGNLINIIIISGLLIGERICVT